MTMRARRSRGENENVVRAGSASFVLLCLVFFAGRDDSCAAQVRRTQEISPVRQHWEPRTGRVSPGTGRKNPRPRASFAPFRGWFIGDRLPTAVRRGLVSFALPASVRSALFAACRNVGQDGI